MLKVVPDPPHHLHSWADTIMTASDCALCAEAAARQTMLTQPVRAACSGLTREESNAVYGAGCAGVRG